MAAWPVASTCGSRLQRTGRLVARGSGWACRGAGAGLAAGAVADVRWRIAVPGRRYRRRNGWPPAAWRPVSTTGRIFISHGRRRGATSAAACSSSRWTLAVIAADGPGDLVALRLAGLRGGGATAPAVTAAAGGDRRGRLGSGRRCRGAAGHRLARRQPAPSAGRHRATDRRTGGGELEWAEQPRAPRPRRRPRHRSSLRVRPPDVLANMLGVARIAATPVVICCCCTLPRCRVAGVRRVRGARLTDFVDGQIARARGEVSPLGIFMDLTADKVLVAGVLIAMVQVSLLSTWIAALLIIRELVVQGVRQLAASADVVMPSRTGARARPWPRWSAWGCCCWRSTRPRGPLASPGDRRVAAPAWPGDHGRGDGAERGLRPRLHPRRAAAAAGRQGRGAPHLISLRSIWRMAMNRQMPQKTTR